MRLPLSGIRVFDLTTVLMGPFCTELLAEMGAEVIKVEPPSGDICRGLQPSRSDRMAPIFMHSNRGKKSLALDLKKPGGLEIAHRLLQEADVFVSNLRPRSLKRLKLDPGRLLEIHPRLIHTNFFGFSEFGPYKGRPAYDDLIQAAVAIPSLIQQAYNEEPRYIPLALMDRFVGTMGALTIASALFERERTGKGRVIELPMFETMARVVLADHLSGLSYDPPAFEPGYKRHLNPFRKPYKTKDGYICVLPYNDRHWKALFSLIGRPDLAKDPRFAKLPERGEHIAELYSILESILAQKTTQEWLKAFEEADIPVAPLKTLKTLFEDAHLRALGFFQHEENPIEGKLWVMNPPFPFLGTQPAPLSPAPDLGQDTVAILKGLDYKETEIEALLASGAAITP